MHREIEAKILNIDPETVQNRLRELDAKLEQELDLEQVIWWLNGAHKNTVRIRRSSDGQVRLTMKHMVPEKGLGYEEWETAVDDYGVVVSIMDQSIDNPLLRLEFTHHRQDWKLDGALININWFPRLTPLLEIEAENEEKVRETARRLGYDPSALINRGVVGLLRDELGLKTGDKVKL